MASDPITKGPIKLRDQTTTKLLAIAAGFELTVARLQEGATEWPDDDVDMTPHEIDELAERLRGLAIRVRTEIAGLAPVVKNADAA
jgi:hypothetical protein